MNQSKDLSPCVIRNVLKSSSVDILNFLSIQLSTNNSIQLWRLLSTGITPSIID